MSAHRRRRSQKAQRPNVRLKTRRSTSFPGVIFTRVDYPNPVMRRGLLRDTDSGRVRMSGARGRGLTSLILLAGCAAAPKAPGGEPVRAAPGSAAPAPPPLAVLAAGEPPDVEGSAPAFDQGRADALERAGRFAELALLMDRVLQDPESARRLVRAGQE